MIMIMIMILAIITITIKTTIMIRIILVIFINIVIIIVIDYDKKWIYMNWKTHFTYFTCGHHWQVFDHDHDHDHDYDHGHCCRLRRPISSPFIYPWILNIANFHVILHTSHVNASARRYKIFLFPTLKISKAFKPAIPYHISHTLNMWRQDRALSLTVTQW